MGARLALASLAILVAGCAGAPAKPAAERARSAPPPPAVYGFGIDVPRRGCGADADCQIFASCDCDRCIPSKRMDIDLCPQPCERDACVGHAPRCDHGLCSTEGYGDSLVRATPAFMGDIARVGQLLLDAPEVAARFRARPAEGAAFVAAWEPRVARPEWTLLGKRVEVVEGLPRSGPVLVPDQIWIEGDKASVTFWYEPEGIMMHGELARGSAGWSLTSVDVQERSR